MDETPIKAGRTKGANGVGKMKQDWLWPIRGEHGDVGFYYAASRAGAVVKEVLGENYKGILQTDGYQVYGRASTIITTNLEPTEWYGLFHNKPLVDAMLDRLQHHCITIRIQRYPRGGADKVRKF